MNFEKDGVHWLINRAPSIFLSRKGKDDVSICRQSEWGFTNADGKRYRTCLRLAAESGEQIRKYEPVPVEISDLKLLQQWGFVDCEPETNKGK